MEITYVVGILISLIFIGFFAGIELAFISANKLSIELRKKQGNYSGITWGKFAEHPTRFIGTTLVGINVVLVIYGILVEDLIDIIWNYAISVYNKINNIETTLIEIQESTFVRFLKLLFATIISTIIVLLFEFVFKAIFKAKNEQILGSAIITGIASFFFGIFSWLSDGLVATAEWILKYLFNVKLQQKKEAFSKIDLEQFIYQLKHHEEDDNSEINKELFENALNLSDIKLRETTIHRKEIIGIDITATTDQARELFIKTKLSKLVVFENNNIDTIVGYIHQLDMFKKPHSISEILVPIPTVPETMAVTSMMNQFTKERKSIAWVVDEFGGTAGIVTMEDLLEEIFGDIKDEYDTEDFVDKQLSANEYIFSGQLETDHISHKYKIDFGEEDELETLSGFIIQNHGTIPKQKETIIINNFQFDILSVSGTRIETVKMKIL